MTTWRARRGNVRRAALLHRWIAYRTTRHSACSLLGGFLFCRSLGRWNRGDLGSVRRLRIALFVDRRNQLAMRILESLDGWKDRRKFDGARGPLRKRSGKPPAQFFILALGGVERFKGFLWGRSLHCCFQIDGARALSRGDWSTSMRTAMLRHRALQRSARPDRVPRCSRQVGTINCLIRAPRASIVNGLVSTCIPGSRWPFPMTAFSA